MVDMNDVMSIVLSSFFVQFAITSAHGLLRHTILLCKYTLLFEKENKLVL